MSSSVAKARANWKEVACSRADFIHTVQRYGAQQYRDLPWRNISDAYHVLVSEVMLQQTQVARVLQYWPRWIAQFPTVDALAAADTATVLEAWQGLGYNRRALALKRACEQCAASYDGTLPRTVDELQALPGIGPATAAGVVAFAYNQPAVYLETNVRSVFLHHLFPQEEGVRDKALVPYIADTCPTQDSRGWYYALLDYGAYLKSQGVNPSRRSAHYARQSTFEGSHRQKRSFVLKQVLAQPEGLSRAEIAQSLNAAEQKSKRPPVSDEILDTLLQQLVAEGFFHKEGTRYIP